MCKTRRISGHSSDDLGDKIRRPPGPPFGPQLSAFGLSNGLGTGVANPMLNSTNLWGSGSHIVTLRVTGLAPRRIPITKIQHIKLMIAHILLLPDIPRSDRCYASVYPKSSQFLDVNSFRVDQKSRILCVIMKRTTLQTILQPRSQGMVANIVGFFFLRKTQRSNPR